MSRQEEEVLCATWRMHSPDRSCRYYIQDVFFWRLAGPVAPTGKAIVHWIGCINAIKFQILLVESPIGVSTGRMSNQGDLGIALGSEI